jgi:flavodoxin
MIKKILLIVFGFCISTVKAEINLENKKILVVYYSLTGNTKERANFIQKEVKGDIFELIQETPYPTDYKEATNTLRGDVDSDFKPVLKNKPQNLKKYDIIFLGSPVWWGQIAPAVKTFLSENDLSGKTIIAFVSHGGGGKGKTKDVIQKFAPNSNVYDVEQFYGKPTENEIKNWIKGLSK